MREILLFDVATVGRLGAPPSVLRALELWFNNTTTSAQAMIFRISILNESHKFTECVGAQILCLQIFCRQYTKYRIYCYMLESRRDTSMETSKTVA
jgi:hypothetical protein